MYYPASRKHLDPTARPTLPERSLFQHPAMDGFDVEGGGAARELRSAVKEDRAFWGEDTSQRMMTRAFEHQWITPAQSQNMALTQIAAAEQLRPVAGFTLGEKVKGPYEK
jgi:acetyl/propionyl-CoA carboxylase alpha subunit